MGCCTSSANNNVEMLESAHSAATGQQDKPSIPSDQPETITSVPSIPSTDIGGIETQTPEQKNEIDKPDKPVAGAETNISKDTHIKIESNDNDIQNKNNIQNTNAKDRIKKTTILITAPPIASIPEDKDIDSNDMETPIVSPDSSFEPNTPYSQIDDRLNLSADEHTLQRQIQMEFQETEAKFEQDEKIHFRNQTFDIQLKTLQMKEFNTLYQVFEKYSTKNDKSKMDQNGLINSLKVFGMVIDKNKDLQKQIFMKFDPDFNDITMIKELDYNDFSSMMSAIVASTDEDALEILFQIFDIDQDGYLQFEDMARILLAVNQIAVVATGEQENCTVTYTRKQCLKQAKRMVARHNLDENKISFDQFSKMMKDKTEKDLMIDHMEQPSISYVMDAPRVSVLIN